MNTGLLGFPQNQIGGLLRSFEAGPFVPVAGAAITLSHPFEFAPIMQLWAINYQPEHGYVPGQHCRVHTVGAVGASGEGCTIRFARNQMTINIPSGGIYVATASGGAPAALTASKWSLKLKAIG